MSFFTILGLCLSFFLAVPSLTNLIGNPDFENFLLTDTSKDGEKFDYFNNDPYWYATNLLGRF